jgi:hypothetical protein
MLIMAVVTMGFVNPAIDGQDGAGVLALQLAFDKEVGNEIIKSWGSAGRTMFVRWIFTDSLYAAAYSVFLAALISTLLLRKGRQGSRYFQAVVLIALLAGACDWLENTMELAFIQNPAEFSTTLFRLHSLVAC